MLSYFYSSKPTVTTSTSIPTSTFSITSNTTGIILTSEGGQGHLHAARKEQQAYQQHGKECVIIHVNQEGWYTFQYTEKYGAAYLPFIASWINHNFAAASIKAWDEAQKNRDLAMQKKIISWQPLANKLFGRNFLEKMTNILHNNPQIDLVVSTQPIAIANIFSAIAGINSMKAKGEQSIQFKVVMTDIPTPYATHFFDSIAGIDEKNLIHTTFILDVPCPPIKACHPSNSDYHRELAKLCPILYRQDKYIPKNGVIINFNMGPIDQKFEELYFACKEKTTERVVSELKKKPFQYN